MTTKKYYAGASGHGGPQSMGFANDWYVLVFEDRQSRDAWLSRTQNISARAIPRRDVTRVAANWSLTEKREIRPEPFTEESWGIRPLNAEDGRNIVGGIVGEIDICGPDDYRYGACMPFYT